MFKGRQQWDSREMTRRQGSPPSPCKQSTRQRLQGASASPRCRGQTGHEHASIAVSHARAGQDVHTGAGQETDCLSDASQMRPINRIINNTELSWIVHWSVIFYWNWGNELEKAHRYDEIEGNEFQYLLSSYSNNLLSKNGQTFAGYNFMKAMSLGLFLLLI